MQKKRQDLAGHTYSNGDDEFIYSDEKLFVLYQSQIILKVYQID